MNKISDIVSKSLNFEQDENYLVSIISEGSFTSAIMNVINNEAVYNGKENTSISRQLYEVYSKDKDYWSNKGVYIYKFINKDLVDYKYIPVTKINIFQSNEIGYIVLYKLYNINPLNEKDKESLKNNLVIENIFNNQNDDIGKTELYYKDINIKISLNKNYLDSKKHIYDDFKVIENIGIDNIIKENFLPWFKGKDFQDRDDNKIINGLKVVNIDYNYHRIINTYSPTKETDFFGEFVFEFVSSSDYTKDMLEAVSMNIFVNNGKVVKVTGYDI